MNFNPLSSKATAASATIVLLIVASVVFDVVGLMIDPGAEEDLALFGSAGIILILANLVAAIVFLVWFHGAASNLRALHPNAHFTFSPGWCVGWWFVPFANLVKPFQAMREVWQHSDEQQSYDAPPILTLWWGTYLGGNIIGNISGRIEDYSVASVVGILSTVFSAVAAFAIVSIMKSISDRQAAAFAARQKETRLQDTLKHAADTSHGL